MSDWLSSLPKYHKNSAEELPPPRRNWGTALWAGFVLLAGVGLCALVRWLAPGFWVFALVPDLLPVVLGMLVVVGLLLLAVFIFAWQRSERSDRGDG